MNLPNNTSYEDYLVYWREVVINYSLDCSRNNDSSLDIEDYYTLGIILGIRDKLAISPVWVIDEMVSYGMDGLHLVNTPLLPVNLFSWNLNNSDNKWMVSVLMNDYSYSDVIDSGYVEGYGWYIDLKNKALVCLFKEYAIRQRSSVMDLSRYLENFRGTDSVSSGISPYEIRLGLLTLAKGIKGKFTSLSISGNDLTYYDKMFRRYCSNGWNDPIGVEEQKATLVRYLLENSVIKTDLIIF